MEKDVQWMQNLLQAPQFCANNMHGLQYEKIGKGQYNRKRIKQPIIFSEPFVTCFINGSNRKSYFCSKVCFHQFKLNNPAHFTYDKLVIVINGEENKWNTSD
jgi:hypothetical protein